MLKLYRILIILACQCFVTNHGSATDRHLRGRWSQGDVRRGIDGGISCAACSVLLGMAEQLGDIHNSTVVAGLDLLCSYLPPDYDSRCSLFMHIFGPIALRLLDSGASPDVICYDTTLCVDQTGKGMCHLFPFTEGGNQKERHLNLTASLRDFLEEKIVESLPWLCWIPGVKQLCDAFEAAFHRVLPGLDVDGDGHSPVESLRGSLWRGRDCHDGNREIHPGRRPYEGDILVDTNCNGILGLNLSSGLAYEEELCGASGARGIIYVGDSVGAHFHVPPQWFSPLEMNEEMFTNLTDVVSREGDWPDLGFATGYRNSTMPSIIQGATDSLYLRLRERNLCNHRDYHNLARNGANSSDTLYYMKAMGREARDLPAILFYSLIGAVCSVITT